jgi:hypothetical protein
MDGRIENPTIIQASLLAFLTRLVPFGPRDRSLLWIKSQRPVPVFGGGILAPAPNGEQTA